MGNKIISRQGTALLLRSGSRTQQVGMNQPVQKLGRGRGQLFGHIPPAGAALQGEVDILHAGAAGQPGPQVLSVGRDLPELRTELG